MNDQCAGQREASPLPRLFDRRRAQCRRQLLTSSRCGFPLAGHGRLPACASVSPQASEPPWPRRIRWTNCVASPSPRASAGRHAHPPVRGWLSPIDTSYFAEACSKWLPEPLPICFLPQRGRGGAPLRPDPDADLPGHGPRQLVASGPRPAAVLLHPPQQPQPARTARHGRGLGWPAPMVRCRPLFRTHIVEESSPRFAGLSRHAAWSGSISNARSPKGIDFDYRRYRLDLSREIHEVTTTPATPRLRHVQRITGRTRQ